MKNLYFILFLILLPFTIKVAAQNTPVAPHALPTIGALPDTPSGARNHGTRELICQGEIRQVLIASVGPSADIDGDGKVEMVCSGNEGSYMGTQRYWYVLEYDSFSQSYQPEYVSELFGEQYLRQISLLNIDQDENPEIILMIDGADLQVLDGITKEPEFTIHIKYPQYSSNREIKKIMLADADNDGITEVIFLSGDHLWLYVQSQSGLTLKSDFPYGAYDVEFGNVDTDPNIETVFSDGKVTRITGEELEIIWTIPDLYYYGQTELLDIDADGMDEIIMNDYSISAWNGDTHQLIYDVYIGSSKLIAKDINGDGINELFHDANSKIHCLNSVTGTEIWNFNNPGSVAFGISINDIDGDGEDELYWVGDDSFDGSVIYVYDVATQQQEWRGIDLDGAFTRVRVTDIDNDGDEEVITLSRESKDGYGEPVMTIYDAVTNTLEWQSSTQFFQWASTAYDFRTEDIDNDDTTEIVLVSSRGRIYVVNGQTHRLQSNKGFSSISSFHTFDIADTDNDGNKEYVICNYTSVMLIDPTTWAIEWTSPELNYNTDYVSYVEVANIDSDPAPEIIFLHGGELSIIDGLTHEIWTHEQKEINTFCLLDENADGISDICVGTLPGNVGIMRAPALNIEWSAIQMNNSINQLQVEDLHSKPGYEYAFMSGGILWFSTHSGEMQGSRRISDTDSKYDCIEISDYDNDGKHEIFAGTSYLVTEMEYDCYKCLAIGVELQADHVTCGQGNNGSVLATVSNGSVPYTYEWNNGMIVAEINDLAPGMYNVTITDQQACEDTATIKVEQLYLQANIHAVRKGCTTQYPGGITTEIVKGKAPFTYAWSNGATTAELIDPPAGTYSVLITDANNCSRELTAQQIHDTVTLRTNIEPKSCNENGFMEVLATGFPPYSYNWSNGSDLPKIDAPVSGTYTVMVTDAYECASSTEVTFPVYTELDIKATILPDNPQTEEADGAISLEPIGGRPPYTINWSIYPEPVDPLIATGLAPNYYWVTIWDSKECFKQFEFELTAGIPDKQCVVYPLPAHDYVTIDLSGNLVNTVSATAEFYNTFGTMELSIQLNSTINNIDISKLSSGLHIIKVTMDGDEQFIKMERVKYRKKE